MFIPVLLGDDKSSALTDSQIIEQVKLHFMLTHPGQMIFNLPWQRMLDGYRSLKKSGRNDSDILIYWASQGMKRDDAGSFIAAMKQVSAGVPVQDPFERPALAEIVSDYSKSIGNIAATLPWKTIILAGAAYIAISQAAKKYI